MGINLNNEAEILNKKIVLAFIENLRNFNPDEREEVLKIIQFMGKVFLSK